MAAVAAFAFVNHGDLLGDMRARPMPALKAIFDGFATVVAVEIGAAFPRYVGLLHLHLNHRARGNGLPVMMALGVQFEAAVIEQFGRQDLPPPAAAMMPNECHASSRDQPSWSSACPWPICKLRRVVSPTPARHDPARALA